MKLFKKVVGVSLACAAALTGSVAWALDIVKDGKSNFVIYHDAKAPKSIIQGAKDLQEYCLKVTGYNMPIVTKTAANMISLGVNEASRAAGLSAEGIPLEGYNIIVKNGSVYILGEDTPDGQRCHGGGISNATRNGIYTLLEECFGVRWLMPGPYGDWFVSKKTVSVPDAGLKGEPGFLNRRLPYIQEFTKSVVTWGDRHKLGYSLYINRPHSWLQVCPPHMFDKHPEWYAMRKGKREYPVGRTYKLCVTNRSTIQHFIDSACEYFKKNPKETTFSLTPSDGQYGWCECPTCAKMYEKDPDGKDSVTPAIIYFYNEVTKGVRAKYPNRFLGGAIYSRYLYPPRKAFKLADGLVLTICPNINYSYKLYRKSSQEATKLLLRDWGKVTDGMSYYDLPMTWWRNGHGCINGPGLELMKFIYPLIAENCKKGILIYGAEAWGHTGLTNYMLAKLSWDPTLDIDKLFKEYCDYAFMEASEEMQQIYHLADKLTKEYILSFPGHGVQVEEPTLKAVGVPLLPEVARLFAAGYKKVNGNTENGKKALQRLEYFKNNMKILQWTLKEFKLIPRDYSSIFDASDDEIASFDDPGVHRVAYFNRPRDLPILPNRFTKVGAGVDLKDAEALEKQPPLRGPSSFIFKAKADGEIRITYTLVGKNETTNKIFFYNDKNELIKWQFLRDNNVRSIPVKAGKVYRAQIRTLYDTYRLKVENAWWGAVSELEDTGVHFVGKKGDGVLQIVHLYVPEGTKKFRMWLRGGGDAERMETAKAELITPAGRKINFNATEQICDLQEIEVKPGESGFWKMNISKGDKGMLDDYYIRILSGIPPVLFPDPANALEIKL